ncbi:uncharacterized protein LOC134537571 isoform X2 [Bacillus rossius redtenbacheri]|uniref:uncharacterized protein LOC134537571 isoform X2 n=1 Tax=Bacillus rossius redtenbacheri TaxID=93214 RepID=UPI002FDDA603
MDLAALSIFTFTVTGVCLLVMIILCALVVYLLIRLNRLEKTTTPQKHCFFNEGIQPDEELSKRGYTMYKGQVLSMKSSESEKTSNTSLGSGKTPRNPQANWRNAGNVP